MNRCRQILSAESEFKINKIEAAEVQLNEAVHLFFNKTNPLVIETLIGATIGILRSLAKKHGIESPLHDAITIKEEYRGLWIKDYLHKAQNYLKHADSDSEEALMYKPSALPFHIYEACHLFRYLASDKYLKYHQSIPALAYETWFGLKYPDLLNNQDEFERFNKLLGMPESFTSDNFELLCDIASKYRVNNYKMWEHIHST